MTIEIIQNNDTNREIEISETEWQAINYVDYIELDANGSIVSDFHVHGAAALLEMNIILSR